MPGLDWLTARPVAHRGLHETARGIVENTASAFSAAIVGNYAIECDLQLAGDGEAMVFHDETLDRLTERRGPIAALSSHELKTISFKATADRMMMLDDLCTLVEGRVPLVIELKSHFNGDARLAIRAAQVLQSYAGPVAVMSFDPAMISAIAMTAPGLPRGLVAERKLLSGIGVGTATYLGAVFQARPHFVAWSVQDLPASLPLLARYAFGLPLLTWTVRTDADRARASRWADQMIFEGFRP
ncbi:glycerophosphodiester phosphodiesterase family protein [Pseudorhodoplanes sinuspersici]|uniref:Glycerophosphodiester phosphodiesterase n=1 Tax=Pseudorhodoplanes sinuspersici TaxID=1235591 RepID=A0A1W6ZVR1_9HYPH|nr:glycerophosphodiester phosphodiesterase family protein [Pseudorhodoplanes sinuspersici]ARQ01474.1 glycerophosphodiester phosphodiesterase [Pseudorhodoplanes sinuspersici]RKE73168.1 glycerophosphoryl diester phosphodiesterase [Pseudorhodoplanes sinuspersici]